MRPSESYDNWPNVITDWGKYRVAGCRDDMQWLLQSAYQGAMGRRWNNLSYCRTKSALIRCIREKTGEIPALAAAALAALPDRYLEGQRPANNNHRHAALAA